MENINNSNLNDKTIDEIENSKEQEYLRKLEAALFVSGKWMSLKDLVILTDLNPIILRTLIDKLKERFGEDRGIEVVCKDDMWKMDVKQEYTNMINKLATGTSEFTKAEQETLAVVAYKQPIKQSVIIKIRGNKAYEHVKKFISLGLMKTKKTGHTMELSLSPDFYDYFHVSGTDAPEQSENSSGIFPVSDKSAEEKQ